MCRNLSFAFIASLVVFVCINQVALCSTNGSTQMHFIANTPNGTQINTKLSEYYNVPVATGNNCTYWYVAQSWHTSEEIADLSTKNQVNGLPTSDYGAFSNDKITMPVSPLSIVAFLGIMYYVSNRIA